MTNLVDLRAAEFNCVKHYFHPGIRVLEIGGGTGFQASLIGALGADVESIDVAEQPEGAPSYFPVSLYDGRTIPFPDRVFDRVFSSNVLEHIRDLDATLTESRRVMKDDGVAIHILPTPAWRMWTSLAHYVHILMRAAGIRRTVATQSSTSQTEKLMQAAGALNFVKRTLWAGPHGEYPSALSELWYFSRRRWVDVFQRNGFQVVTAASSKIYYTGYGVFPWLPMAARRILASILGSATRVFILRKAP